MILMAYDEEIPRRKKDPLKGFRDPRTEREESYKRKLRIEEDNRRRRWMDRRGKEDE